MHRREFLKQGGTALALAALPLPVSIAARAQPKPLRVGLIGTGWYGKADLLRLIQVAPVDVVSICDVDSQMLSERRRADRVATGLEEAAAHLSRLPGDAEGDATSTSSSSARLTTGTRSRPSRR